MKSGGKKYRLLNKGQSGEAVGTTLGVVITLLLPEPNHMEEETT